MAKRDDGGSKGRRDVVVDTVADVIVDARGVVTPLSKSARKELRKLEKQLVAARKTESKRVRQLATAIATKGRKQVARRRKQVAESESEVAHLASRVAALATAAASTAVSAASSAADVVGGAVGGAARTVGAAAVQATQVVTPIRPSNPAATSGAARR